MRIAASFNATGAPRCHAGVVSLRCLIVDDNASFLHAAGALLERQGVTVVGLASNAADAVRRERELRPDVVLVDIVLGPESGFDVARALAERDGDGPTVVLISTHAEADFADLIEESPATGFVPKSELSAEAIRRVVG
jgi:DNA-binding NarL/FixJ family response regulator